MCFNSLFQLKFFTNCIVSGIELYNGIPNSLFHRVARHESHPLHVSLWKMISNLDTDALTMMYALASSNSVLAKMGASGTDKLPSVRTCT